MDGRREIKMICCWSSMEALRTRCFPMQQPRESYSTASYRRRLTRGGTPRHFESMLSRVAGVSKKAAVRALIHLLDQAREVQLSILERGEPEPKEETLFSRQTFRGALPEISKVRLENTRFAEYPSVRDRIVAFEGEKTNQNLHSLGEIWHLSEEKARDVAESLVEIGFFERRGDKASPVYWVPILYRPALNMVQGSAEPGMPHDPDES